MNCVCAAWRFILCRQWFIADTQKLGLVHVSPGRQFLEKFQKPDFLSVFHVNRNLNPAYITIQSIMNNRNIRQLIGTPLTWISLASP